MKKNILAFYLISLFLGLAAQKEDGNTPATYYKTTTCKSFFPKVLLKGERNPSNVEKYLTGNISNLNDTKVGLKMNYVNESPGGFHYSFTQTFNGIKIYQSEIKINLDRHNVIRSVFDNSENTARWNLNTESATANSVIAINPSTQLPVVAQKIVDKNSNEILTANGEIIFQHSLRSYFTNQDSLVYGNIFNPDPLTTAQTYYGAPYINDSGRTNSSLNAQMQNVAFRTNFNGSQFTLESAFVRESDFDPPNIAPATSSTPQFNFNRSESGFQDVNAFYHISTMYKYIHSLGFNCADSLVEIDTHALSGADQSYFTSGFIPHRIYYGIGGVPDCEDADVCVHEWGHSISYTAAPESNYGLQRNSLDEGFGDYLAGSYSRSISTFNEYWVFNWDGHNEFWSGRILNTCRTYPDSLSTSIYKIGEM